jgi:hypothetical protein
MSDSFAAPSCTIEVYPFEGGGFIINGGQIVRAQVTKSLRNIDGQMMIELAPGGPYGPEDPKTWSQIITPMSHVLVGMSRGSEAAVVMDGIARSIREGQEWHTDQQNGSIAARSQIVEGADFGWFFATFNWYALTFLGMTAGTTEGAALGFAPAGVPYLLSQGLLGMSASGGINPRLVGQQWYEKVMAGQGAILGTTYVPYWNNSRVSFSGAVSTLWEDYPQVFVPYGDYFLAAEESWAAKFANIFPDPWYEFFVTTAPHGAYTFATGATGAATSGMAFTMTSQPLALPAGPQLVARVNPIPALNATVDSATTAITIGQVDTTRWHALPIYDLTLRPYGFYDSEIEFSADGARNFYMLNPTSYTTMFGVNNANSTPFPFAFMGAADPDSVHRYGYRPQIGTMRWMFDPTGTAAQNGNYNIAQTVGTLLMRLVSWHHPRPLMANAQVVLPLSPDILIGTRFRYAPYKNGEVWEFYIEGFKHDFVFGEDSTTTLTLTRGLPVAVYDDVSANGMLRNVLLGNAERFEGYYVPGLQAGAGSGLVTFGPPGSITTLMGNMAQVLVTPGQK